MDWTVAILFQFSGFPLVFVEAVVLAIAFLVTRRHVLLVGGETTVV